MKIDGTTLVIIILLLFSLGPLFSALKEKAPNLRRRRPSAFRQFPTHPVQDDEDFEIHL